MAEDHANMPGMGDKAKKPDQGKSATPQGTKEPAASAQSDKAKTPAPPKKP